MAYFKMVGLDESVDDLIYCMSAMTVPPPTVAGGTPVLPLPLDPDQFYLDHTAADPGAPVVADVSALSAMQQDTPLTMTTAPESIVPPLPSFEFSPSVLFPANPSAYEPGTIFGDLQLSASGRADDPLMTSLRATHDQVFAPVWLPTAAGADSVDQLQPPIKAPSLQSHTPLPAPVTQAHEDWINAHLCNRTTVGTVPSAAADAAAIRRAHQVGFMETAALGNASRTALAATASTPAFMLRKALGMPPTSMARREQAMSCGTSVPVVSPALGLKRTAESELAGHVAKVPRVQEGVTGRAVAAVLLWAEQVQDGEDEEDEWTEEEEEDGWMGAED
ncbi:hypothetical protein AMAG_14891 [Allomyces macrogynus ATCC 38327]|uniref:Uncharacterized protein n=1 Tax=Allomyces macrogynus (strain ATCC 38327) TaxID=578462 RepID=A0A0L0T7I1_ALLM3|nr:hypothetical protein AMAG_14891 [Allomyces macrogynus ATCC 38327]|eukprot:KNE70768.1 hypothetical protein AMAG_14891 [Allomyces macrogynus ATCC 38327]